MPALPHETPLASKISALIRDRLETEGCEDCGTLSTRDCTFLGRDIAELMPSATPNPEAATAIAKRAASTILDRLETEGCEDCGTLSFSDCDDLGRELSALAA